MARAASVEFLNQSVCKDHLEAFLCQEKFTNMRQTRHLNWYCFPHPINLARPLAKGFEHLRPGVMGFSQARRKGKVETRPFPLKIIK